MLSQDQKQQLKAIPIVEYLASKGFQPAKARGNEYVYYSPIRKEKTPSFFVNPSKNLYQDYGNDGGDIIKLVMAMEGLNFVSAATALMQWKPEIDQTIKQLFPTDQSNPTQSGIEVIEVKPIEHQALISYLSSRKIPFSFAAKYLKEVHYQNNGKRFFSIGFANDKGGWALRNNRFKNCIGAQGTTYFSMPGATKISIFEGFFDFLSALVYYKVPASRHSVLVLNSTSNLKSAQDTLAKYQMIYAYLDNDAAGANSLSEIEKWKFPFTDKSGIYTGYNDFSEMICADKTKLHRR
jgi:hypothetical protein